MKEKLRKIHWRKWLLRVLVVVFLFSGGMMAHDLIRSSQERKANAALAQQVHDIKSRLQRGGVSADMGEGLQSKYSENGVLVQYDGLWQQNNDLGGWLYIPDTVVDYPVMFTPDNWEYYLRKGFDKKYATSGCLFIGEGCVPSANQVLIHGHRMNDGSMFAALLSYADETFGLDHSTIYYDTLTDEGTYQLLGAFYSRIYNVKETGVFRYYQYNNLTQPDIFDEFVSQVQAASLYDTGVDAVYGDKLLTLSTCSYHEKNGRFVVVAKRVA